MKMPFGLAFRGAIRPMLATFFAVLVFFDSASLLRASARSKTLSPKLACRHRRRVLVLRPARRAAEVTPQSSGRGKTGNPMFCPYYDWVKS